MNSRMAMWNKINKIIAIAAHFDDIEINCGGTIAGANSCGIETMLVIVANGEYEDFVGKKHRNKEQARQESLLAANILNIPESNIRCLGFKDKYVPFDVILIEKINSILSEFGPDLILTHWINDTHQDHINTAKSVLSAARNYSSILMWEPMPICGRSNLISFNPQIYIDISTTHQKKIKAITCHQSQLIKYKQVNYNLIKATKIRAQFRGVEANCDYAEAFETVRMKISI